MRVGWGCSGEQQLVVVELFAGWTVEEKAQVYTLLAGLKRHLGSVETMLSKKPKTKEKSA